MATLFATTSSIVIACVSALLTAAYVFKLAYNAYTSPLKSIPGPWHTKYTNLALKMATIKGRRVYYIDDLHKRYGTVVRVSPWEVVCSDVDGFKRIHSVSSRFEKSAWYAAFTDFPRLGVFTMRNTYDHAARRKVVAKGLSKSYLREHFEGMVRENTEIAIEKIKLEATNGNSDVLEWFTFLALDIVGFLGFGESFGMVESGERTKYIRVLEKARVGNGIGAELPLVRSIGMRLPFQGAQETFNASAWILDYAMKAVKKCSAQSGERNYVSTVRSEAQKSKHPFDDLDMCIESTNLIFAGSGTVSLTLTFLMYAVMQQPMLQAALEEEVSKLNPDFDEATLETLPLLNAIIEEVLRLYCAVPGTLPRVVPIGGIEIAGYYIPQGAVVSTQAWTLHRDEKLFANPHTFDPSRWLPNTTTPMSAEAKSAFCAFGAGASSCLGLHLARMEMRYATAMFFRECKGARLAATTTPASMEPVNFFVITPRDKRCDITLKPMGV